MNIKRLLSLLYKILKPLPNPPLKGEGARVFFLPNSPLKGEGARVFSLILLALIALMSILIFSVEGVATTNSSLIAQSTNALQLANQAQQLYDIGQFEEAAKIWQEAADAYTQEGNQEGVMESLINKAGSLQSLGFYPRACNTLLQAFKIDIDKLDCHKLIRENEEQQEKENKDKKTSQDYFFIRLNEQPNSIAKAIGLRSLGDVLQRLDSNGDLALSEQVLTLSLKVAKELSSPANESAALLSLGNNELAKGKRRQAQKDTLNYPKPTPLYCINKPSKDQSFQNAANYYQQAGESVAPTTKIKAQLNHLDVLLILQQLSEANTLWETIQSEINKLPTTPASVLAKIKFTHSSICLQQYSGNNSALLPNIEQLLTITLKDAQNIGDRRNESYALGYMGGIYAIKNDFIHAENLTKQALSIAVKIQAADIAYLWAWQLGYLFKQQGDIKEAIAYYVEAFNNIESLRRNLVVLPADIQFSFKENVEPVYRQLVDLLLQPEVTQDDVNRVVLNIPTIPSQEKPAEGQKSIVPKPPLELAREVIESLQVAELENFLRCSLQDAKVASIDQEIDPTAAVIYPVILDNRIEVILSLYNQPLHHYSNPLPTDKKIEFIIDILRNSLSHKNSTSRDSINRLKQNANQLYDLLLGEKFEDLLKNYQVNKLVFVLDGVLQNIPMAALYDGEKYLIQKYAIALSPSLQLLKPAPLARKRLEALVAGLSEKHGDISALPAVREEVEQVRSILSGIELLNDDFTYEAIAQTINSRPFSIVHFATHGKFNFQAKDTFILASDGPININQLRKLLKTRERSRPNPIELLTLSACETAEGNKRATLGLAGIAIQSGARSTLATLWQVADDTTTSLMIDFYKQLVNDSKITKAEALQHAQVKLLDMGKHPYYWAPFVLIGNWL